MPYLLKSGRFLLEDLLSTLFFVILITLTHSIYLATGVAILVGVIQLAWTMARRKPVGPMQVLGLGLVVVMGGATLSTHDPRFVMVKPTIILGAIGLVMLKRGWMNRYLPDIVTELVPDLGLVFGYVWAGVMLTTAGANLVFALFADPRTWALFIGIVPLASKIALFLIQYATMRVVARRRYLARKVPDEAIIAGA
jgi:intracellular septation protein